MVIYAFLSVINHYSKYLQQTCRFPSHKAANSLQALLQTCLKYCCNLQQCLQKVIVLFIVLFR